MMMTILMITILFKIPVTVIISSNLTVSCSESAVSILCILFFSQQQTFTTSINPLFGGIICLLSSSFNLSIFLYIQYPSSVHVQTILVWGLYLYLKHLTCTADPPYPCLILSNCVIPKENLSTWSSAFLCSVTLSKPHSIVGHTPVLPFITHQPDNLINSFQSLCLASSNLHSFPFPDVPPLVSAVTTDYNVLCKLRTPI